MQRIAALAVMLQVLALHMLLPAAPALAQEAVGARTVRTVSWIEEWDPAQARWVRVSAAAPAATAVLRESQALSVSESVIARTPLATITTRTYEAQGYEATRFATPASRPTPPAAIARYGPFVVIDEARAAMIGASDAASPAQFDAMLRDYPGLATLEMIEAPGTSNDIANLALGRRIRAAGLSTHVPRGGSVRSGAVELFLAGVTRRIDKGAQFAVHAWLDEQGREPDDFAPDAPANRLYLDYYQEMGMSAARARAFYAMTNSVPHASARWLRAEDMRRWIAPEPRQTAFIAPAPVAQAPLALAPMQLAIPAFADQPSLRYGDVGGLNMASAEGSERKAFLDS